MQNKFKESNQIVAIHSKNARILVVAFFKCICQQSSKKHFYEICYCYILDYMFLQPQYFE